MAEADIADGLAAAALDGLAGHEGVHASDDEVADDGSDLELDEAVADEGDEGDCDGEAGGALDPPEDDEDDGEESAAEGADEAEGMDGEAAAAAATAAPLTTTATVAGERRGRGSVSAGTRAVFPALIRSEFATCRPVIRFCYEGATEPFASNIRKVLKWRFTKVTPNVVKKMVRGSGFTATTKSESWIGTWGRHMKAESFKRLAPHQKFNHYPGSFNLGRKDRLWKNIARMIARFGRKEYGFIPDTYCLPGDMQQLKRAFDEAGAKGKWILKPNASARGIGIRVVHEWSQIPKKRPYLVQEYLCNPYLINDTKFDLRVYVYVASFDPLRVYVCRDGLVRFATQKYSNKKSALKNRYMHLTNYSINKNSEDFEQNSDADACSGHKWGLKALWGYMQERGVDTEPVWQSMCDVVIKTLMCVEGSINSGIKHNCKRRYNCHELFGFDIMLDANLKPWLIEVNISPSLHTGSQLDSDIKGRMIADVYNIAGFRLPDPKLEPGLRRTRYAERDHKGFTSHLSAVERSKHAYFVQGKDGSTASILDELTDDDVAMLMETEDEMARAGDLQRIFPTAESTAYLRLTETPRYYNLLLDAWTQRFRGNPGAGLHFLKGVAQVAYDQAKDRKGAVDSRFARQLKADEFLTKNQFYVVPRRALTKKGAGADLTRRASPSDASRGSQPGAEQRPGRDLISSATERLARMSTSPAHRSRQPSASSPARSASARTYSPHRGPARPPPGPGSPRRTAVLPGPHSPKPASPIARKARRSAGPADARAKAVPRVSISFADLQAKGFSQPRP